MKKHLDKVTSGTNNRGKHSLFKSKATHDYQPLTSSMIEPSNPNAKNTWNSQFKKKPSNNNWIIYITLGLGVILIILLVIFLTLPDPESDQVKIPEEDPSIITDDSLIDEDSGLNRFFTALAEDPKSPYMPDFSASKEYYPEPPTDFSCATIKEVKNMNPTILNLYLNNGSVVILSGKWRTSSGEANKAILIFGGTLTDSIYKTIPISCPNSSDTILKTPASPINEPYINYSGSELFDGLTSDHHFYVWPEATSASSGEE